MIHRRWSLLIGPVSVASAAVAVVVVANFILTDSFSKRDQGKEVSPGRK